MANDQVEFSFVAEVAKAIAGITQLESKLGSAASTTKAEAKVIQDALNSIGNTKVKTALFDGLFKDLKSADKAVEETSHHIKDSLADMIPGGGLTSKLGALLNPVALGVAALGGAMIEGAMKAAEWAHQIEVASQKLGVSTTYLQKMHGAALLAGVSTEAFDNSFAKLNVTAGKAAMGQKQASEAFTRLGVSVRDSNGDVKSSQTIYDETRDALSKIESPAVRAAAAQAIFGKGSKETAAILAQTSEEFNKNKEYMLDYATATDASIQSAAKLGTAGEALGQTFKAGVITAFAPLSELLADMAKAIIPVLSDTFKALSVVMQVIVAVVRACWDVFKSLVSIIISYFTPLANMVTGFLRVVGVLGTTGKSAKSMHDVFYDVLTSMISQTAQATGEIVGSFRWMAAEVQNLFAGMNNFVADSALGKKLGLSHMDLANADQAYKDGQKYGQGLYKGALDGLKKAKDEKGEAAGDGGLGGSMAGKAPKEKKAKAPKDDLIQKLNEQLQEQKNAWDKEQVLQGTHEAFSLKQEAQFWKDKQALAKEGTKDRTDIDKQYYSAALKLQDEDHQKHIAALKEQLADENLTADQRIAILRQIEREETAYYKNKSSEAQQASKEVIKALSEEQKANKQLKASQDDKLQEAQDQKQHLQGIKSEFQLKMDLLEREHQKRLQLINDAKGLSDADKQDRIDEEAKIAALDKQNAQLERQQQNAQTITSMMNEAVQAIGSGKQAMLDYFKQMIAKLVAAVIEAAILSALLPGGGAAIGMGGKGGFGNVLGGLLNFKAVGGSVTSNSPYMVGERGPELFVPNTGGNIITNSAMSSMGGSGVSLAPVYNITLSDNPQTNVQTLAQIKMQQREQMAMIDQYNRTPRWSKK